MDETLSEKSGDQRLGKEVPLKIKPLKATLSLPIMENHIMDVVPKSFQEMSTLDQRSGFHVGSMPAEGLEVFESDPNDLEVVHYKPKTHKSRRKKASRRKTENDLVSLSSHDGDTVSVASVNAVVSPGSPESGYRSVIENASPKMVEYGREESESEANTGGDRDLTDGSPQPDVSAGCGSVGGGGKDVLGDGVCTSNKSGDMSNDVACVSLELDTAVNLQWVNPARSGPTDQSGTDIDTQSGEVCTDIWSNKSSLLADGVKREFEPGPEKTVQSETQTGASPQAEADDPVCHIDQGTDSCKCMEEVSIYDSPSLAGNTKCKTEDSPQEVTTDMLPGSEKKVSGSTENFSVTQNTDFADSDSVSTPVSEAAPEFPTESISTESAAVASADSEPSLSSRDSTPTGTPTRAAPHEAEIPVDNNLKLLLMLEVFEEEHLEKFVKVSILGFLYRTPV